MNSAKKRKINSDVQKHKVTIAPYNDNTTNDSRFDRSYPHLEGRWVGHLHLPLPSFDSLDLLQEVVEGIPTIRNEQRDTSTSSDNQANSQSSDDESCSDAA